LITSPEGYVMNHNTPRLVRHLRIGLGQNQLDVANECDVTQAAISKFEKTGKAGPRLRKRLSRHFGRPIHELVQFVEFVRPSR